jgi:uncharacterized protein (DUF1501 family)
MFLVGNRVKGGHYGEIPSLTDLTEGGNLKHTTDFRRVYATAIDGWLQQDSAQEVLKGQFPAFPVFGV